MALSTYINDVVALLNDQQFSFTSQKQLVRWINEARRQCAKRTGCIRRLITGQSAFGASAQPGFAIPGAAQPGSLPGAFPQQAFGASGGGSFDSSFDSSFSHGSSSRFGVAGAVQNGMMTIPNVERYPFQGFFNPALQAQHAGVESVMDPIALSINWGGTVRPSLDWMPWDDFQAYARAYAVLNQSYPALWSVYNDGPMGEIWVFPVPVQANEMELDCFCLPNNIYSDDAVDAIPEAFRDSIKYGAASLAFMGSNRYSNAQAMEDMFADRLGVARVAVDRGKTPSYYFRGV